MFALEKMKKLVNTICTKLVIEIQLIIRKFPVWFSVEDIAYLQVQHGSNKTNAGKKFHKRLREMVKQPEDQFDEQGTTYHSTHFMMETVNLAPFVVF